MDRPLVIVDADDTLWLTEPLYDTVLGWSAEWVERRQLDPVQFLALQRARDLANVATLGLSSRRFPTSCRQAYEALAAEVGRPAQDAAELQRMAEAVFELRAELMPGADDALRALAEPADLVLLTKGDVTVQQRRLLASGLRGRFTAVHVVPRKSRRSFTEIVTRTGTAQETWSVGNSLVSDVAPALSAGLSAVWVPAHVWELESPREPLPAGRVVTAADLPSAVAFLRSELRPGRRRAA